MSEVEVARVSGWNVVGRLYDTEDPEMLGEDMVEARYPGKKVSISAGWTPEYDISGSYKITVTAGLKHVQDPIFVTSLPAAKIAIEELMKSYTPNEYRSDLNPPVLTKYADEVEDIEFTFEFDESGHSYKLQAAC